MDWYLVSVLALIVALLIAFGCICHRNCYSNDEQERSQCRGWGGGVLVVIVVLMIAAVVMSCNQDKDSVTMATAVDGNVKVPHEEYFASTLGDMTSVTHLDDPREVFG